jgi:hypothetical protein
LPSDDRLPSSRRRPDGKGGHFDRQLRGSAEPLTGRCGRKLNKTDPPRYCTQRPRRGRKRCGAAGHGGTVATGPASKQWKHGRDSLYGKLLPMGPMLDGYRNAVQASELRTLREQIGLAAGLEQELVARIAGGGGGFAEWRRARDLGGQVEKALQAKDTEQAAESLRKLLEVLKLGGQQGDAASDLAETLDLRRRLVDTESKITFRIAGGVTVEQLLVMTRQNGDLTLQAITLAVREGEEPARRWLTNELRALAMGKPGKLAVVR